MRLCRFQRDDHVEVGFYGDDHVVPLSAASHLAGVDLATTDELVELLPGGAQRQGVEAVQKAWEALSEDRRREFHISIDEIQLRVPVGNPGKLLLLAGNYSKHIEEGGGHAVERAQTFPYVFMKPIATTLTHPGNPVKIPAVSPDHIDWEIELGVIMGRECSAVTEAEALNYVAGYTVVNDISDRKFRPNPGREKRDKDSFFDWLHGKWHDTFCPIGPCVLPADEVADPQQLHLTLRLNGEVEQDAGASGMIFPVAGIVAFISSFVTLHPGDIIATGTPDGVGSAKGKFLKAGDQLEAQISRIGVLRNPVV
ncbi:MAG: fumarylacetoacetate hydrolase family protein [Planctomycetales bacterium]|nr:fumarylacetoacetate hydrolase family protein [Planctomycetales bacterium]